LWLLLPAVFCPAQEALPEYRIKAAYLYNFAKFVEWPADVPRQGPIAICVMGKDPFGDALRETLAGRAAAGRALEARGISEEADPRGCHMVFFGAYPLERLAPALRRAERAGALTVGETRAFKDREGMIRFIEEGGRVRFEVNLGPVHRAGIRLNSRLLRVARAVHGSAALER